MRIGILETDIPSPAMRARRGDFADMFVKWLSPVLPEASWDRIAVHAGQDLPDRGAHDGYLITGCRLGVYDRPTWLAPLSDFLRHLRDSRVPMGGICFGHQVMAHAFGAEVTKSEGGWILGAETYDGKTAFAMHQDQVQTVPTGARTITGSTRCGIGRIAYEFPALSVQYHPEFTRDIMADLLAEYGGTQIEKPLTDAAMRTLDARTDRAEIAHDFAALLRAGRGAPGTTGKPRH